MTHITDGSPRPLRPIGMSSHEVVRRTGDLLARLTRVPGVRLRAGVRVGDHVPPITYAISSGRRLLLVEPVAWPSGAYTTTPAGGVLCDGTYIGQSVHPLIGSVRALRRVLRRHQVAAVVVVFPSGAETPSLPDKPSADLAWLSPDEVRRHLAGRLRRNYSCQTDNISWYSRTSSTP